MKHYSLSEIHPSTKKSSKSKRTPLNDEEAQKKRRITIRERRKAAKPKLVDTRSKIEDLEEKQEDSLEATFDDINRDYTEIYRRQHQRYNWSCWCRGSLACNTFDDGEIYCEIMPRYSRRIERLL